MSHENPSNPEVDLPKVSRRERWKAKRENRQPWSTNKKRATIAAGILAVGLGACGVKDNNTKNNILRQADLDEVRIAQYNGQHPMRCIARTVIAATGVEVYENPVKIKNKAAYGFLSKTNVAFKVESGEELVLKQPMWHVDKNKDGWYSFALGEAELPKSTGFVDAIQVADKTLWINYDDYAKARNGQKEPLITTFDMRQAPVGQSLLASCELSSETGQIQSMVDKDPIAVGYFNGAGDFERNLNANTYAK